MRVAPAMAGAVAGLAAWSTAGVLDAMDGPSGPVRLAMLPPLTTAAALAIAGAALVVSGASLVARLSTGRWSPLTREETDWCLPLLATGALVLPFLPLVPDLAPVLVVLAGPFAWLVWSVSLSLTLRAAVLRVWRARGLRVAIPAPAVAGVFLATVLICGSAAARLVETPLFPGGDEPHYLVIAQSLWRDGDLRIENNHRRGDTLEYFSRPLKPDYLTRGVDREIYSIHPVGLGVLLAPVYALGGYRGVVAFLVIVASAAATCAWRLAARLTDAPSASVAWLACAATAPWVFNSFTVYPEVPASLAVVVAFTCALGIDRVASGSRLLLSMAGSGAALAALPWLSSKYAPMSLSLGLVILGRLWLPQRTADAGTPRTLRTVGDRVRATVALGVIPAVSGIGWLTFFWLVWGTPSPSAPYGTQNAMEVSYLAAGGPGLFFDQEYGVVSAAPVLLVALAGLVTMTRRPGPSRRIAQEMALVGASLVATVAAFHIWWGGTAAVGRPIISALPLLAVPFAWQARDWSSSRALTGAVWLLLAASLAITVTLAVAQHGLLLAADRDGTSRLLDWWSPVWPLWSAAPSFVAQPTLRAWMATIVWLVLIAGGLALLRTSRAAMLEGRAGTAVSGIAGLVLVTAGLVVPAIAPAGAAPPAMSARARSQLLDHFDAGRRPIAVIYDPLRLVSPEQAPSSLVFTARPDVARPAPVPRLLHAARWALPAGRYDVELIVPAGAVAAGSLGLQVGRAGPPIRTWTLAGSTGRTWRSRFSLAIDAGFVGFVPSADLAAMGPTVHVKPVDIESRSKRPPALEVVQTRHLGGADVYFHDDNADPEPAGFWTRRDRVTRVTVAADGGPHRLRIVAGPAEATVIVRMDDRLERIDLPPRGHHEVVMPADRSPCRIELDTRGGFVPAEIDPASDDARALGCWIEVVGGS